MILMVRIFITLSQIHNCLPVLSTNNNLDSALPNNMLLTFFIMIFIFVVFMDFASGAENRNILNSVAKETFIGFMIYLIGEIFGHCMLFY